MSYHLERRVAHLEAEIARLTRTIEGIGIMGLNLSQLIVDINDNTNAVAARLDKLAADLAAAQGSAVTDAQLAELATIAEHLKTLGADPQNPVPAPPPVVTEATHAAASTSTPPVVDTGTGDTGGPIDGGTTDPATPPIPSSPDGSSSTPSA